MTNTNKHITKSLHLDDEYFLWLAEVKSRYRSAQLKAAVKVNSEKLFFNWQLGAEIVQKKAEEHWGVGVVGQLSRNLQNEFPNSEGFTFRNLHFMKQWYLFYSAAEHNKKLKQAVSEYEQYKIKIMKPLQLLNRSFGEGCSPNQTDDTQSGENRNGGVACRLRTLTLLVSLLFLGTGLMWG